VLGSGTWSSTMNPSSMTSLVYPSQTVPIQSVSVVGDGTARLRFVISNSSLSLGYLLSEIGIYAQTTSSPNTLYTVTYANNPDFIPANGVTKIEDVIDIYTVVSNAQSVTAVINNSVMLATMQDLYTARPEFSSSTPTDLYPGKIWVSDTQPAMFYNGTQWQLFNAGLVDGFPVSATPTPNALLPLNSNAQFPFSVLPPGIGNAYANPINLTSATADYMLQPGEVAYISFTSATSVPLNIATTNGTYYEMDLVSSNSVGTSSWGGGDIFLNPNNTTYSNAFNYNELAYITGGSSAVGGSSTFSAFRIGWGFSDVECTIGNFTTYKTVKGIDTDTGTVNSPLMHVYGTQWNDTTTSWTSLGTITFPQQTSGYVLVRRLA